MFLGAVFLFKSVFQKLPYVLSNINRKTPNKNLLLKLLYSLKKKSKSEHLLYLLNAYKMSSLVTKTKI